MATILDKPEQISLFQMMSQRSALGLELKGLRFSRGSVYAMCKRTYGLKGSKQKVYDQMCALVDAAKAKREQG